MSSVSNNNKHKDKAMSCKFVEYQIARYGVYENGYESHIDRMSVEDDLEAQTEDFWALEGVLPSETFELFEVCRGSFSLCVKVYQHITGHETPLIQPDHRTEYAIERLSV
jgi:hypothetical protein